MPLNIYRKIRFLFNFNTRISLQKYGFENQTARPWKTLHITKEKKKGSKIKSIIFEEFSVNGGGDPQSVKKKISNQKKPKKQTNMFRMLWNG